MVELVSNYLTAPADGSAPLVTEAAGSSAFVAQGVKIAKKDMEVVNDAKPLIEKCLQYNLLQTLDAIDGNVEIAKVALEPGFGLLVAQLVSDYKSGSFLACEEENFSENFKTYVKNLGKELGLKGKGLFHPLRLALTGRMSGPDIGDQLKLLALADGNLAANSYNSLAARMEVLEGIDVAALKVESDVRA